MTPQGQSTATREWRLRTSLILLLVTAMVATFGIIGSGVLLVRVPVALKEDRVLMRSLAVNLAQHFEQWVDGLEGHARQQPAGHEHQTHQRHEQQCQIGRASCRERVSSPV